jgi:hypothetical protein
VTSTRPNLVHDVTTGMPDERSLAKARWAPEPQGEPDPEKDPAGGPARGACAPVVCPLAVTPTPVSHPGLNSGSAPLHAGARRCPPLGSRLPHCQMVIPQRSACSLTRAGRQSHPLGAGEPTGEPISPGAPRTQPYTYGRLTPSDLHSGELVLTATDARECFASRGSWVRVPSSPPQKSWSGRCRGSGPGSSRSGATST